MSEWLAEWVVGFELDQIDASSVETAKHAILDALACTVAGSTEEGSRIVRDWVGSMTAAPQAAILGTDERASTALAALANATAAHALDLDDVAMTMIHPSAILVPTLFALAERGGHTGAEVLAAYVVGFEVMTRICRQINPEHYARGWHSMQSVGVLGTAAAAARLLGLDQTRTTHAIAIAASSSGGIRKNFGSMVKPLHGGHAAQHGVEAAELASRGFTGGEAILEGRNGFLQVFTAVDDHARLRDAFAADAPFELEQSGVALKRFACCGAIHTALDTLERMRQSPDFDLEAIRRVECRVNPLTPGILLHPHAHTGLEGKFSMEYSAAVMLLTGKAGLEQFTDEQAADPRLRRLMSLVDVVVDEELPIDLAYFATVVTIEFDSGHRVTVRNDAQHGYPHDPLTGEERHAKVAECSEGILAPSAVAALIRSVESLETAASIDPIVSHLVPSTESL